MYKIIHVQNKTKTSIDKNIACYENLLRRYFFIKFSLYKNIQTYQSQSISGNHQLD